MARCTVRSDKQVRSQIVPTDGQQTPASLAWSASEISTAFCVGAICSGQQRDMTRVLIPDPFESTFGRKGLLKPGL
jgi:hypothetical protein